MLRRTRIQPRAPRRRAADEVYDPYVRWIHGLECCVCGGDANIQGSHVGYGGVGLKHGSAADMVPMCGPHFTPRSTLALATIGCHAEWEQHKGLFSEADRGERALLAIHWRLETWERFVLWADNLPEGYDEHGEHETCVNAIRKRLSLLEVDGA